MATSKEITPFEGGIPALVVTQEQRELIKRTVAKGATDDELDLFIYDCKRRGVHPMDRMIFFIKRTGGKDGPQATHQCSIDYFRSEAENSGEYDGQDETEFGPVINKYPEWAKVRVYRKGITRPFVGEAAWKEYYPGEKMGFMWRKMPRTMLAKCAEALAIRKAFPKKFAGLHTSEEMAQSNIIDVGDVSYVETVTENTPEPTSGAVKPAANTHHEPEKLSVQEALMKELAEYCMGDEVRMAEVLKEDTHYTDLAGNEQFMEVSMIATMPGAWAGKALRKLRERKPMEG